MCLQPHILFMIKQSRMGRLAQSIYVPEQIQRLSSRSPHWLTFPKELELLFERDRGSARSLRLWREGLISIVAFNLFYLGEWLLTAEVTTHEMLMQIGVITPLALLVNLGMRFEPPKWIREGSVALMSSVIACVYLYLQHGKGPVAVAFTPVGAIVAAMFTGVVMRLRFFYALAASAVILVSALVFVVMQGALTPQQKVMGASLTTIAIGITMMSNFSLEREERLGYLRFLESEGRSREVSAVNARLQRLSTIDTLTGLANRRGYEARFQELWSEAERDETPLSMLLVDVDHFKILNDVRGHMYGDEVLRRVGSLMMQALRSREDFAGRYGGEEFVILLPKTDRESAEKVGERVRTLVEMAGSPPQDQLSGDCLMWVTASCGVSTCESTAGRRKEELLEAADRAMYEAKSEGRNRVQYRTLKPRMALERGETSSLGVR